MVKIKLKPQADPKRSEAIRKELKIDETVAALLVQRGFDDPEKARKFLFATVGDMSDPYELAGMREAAQAVRDAISQRKRIVIFGDYDCDGIGAAAIVYLTLKELNANVGYFIPERKNDGYGISWSAVTRLFEQDAADLIVSVDCGISSYREIERAKREYCADFVITDHHELPETLPDAILVNPHFGSETEFCGAGVALKLSEALIGRERALKYADICCLSTVADVVPLTGENRIIVKEGLKLFQKRRIRPGLKELLRISGIDGNAAVTSRDVAFKLAPRINASGRLDSAQKSIELLIEDDVSSLRLLAESLNADNLLRQEKTEEAVESAKERLKDYDLARFHVVVLEDDGWDAGVLGIAASRIAEYCRRPVILLTEKEGCYSGSARSVSGVNLYDMLKTASEYLLKFGGHSAAAGLSLKRENLAAFREACRAYLESRAEVFAELRFAVADLRVTGEENVEFYKRLELLEPFGMGNPKPVVLWDRPVKWQRINTKPHLKASAGADTELIAFSKGDMLERFGLFGAKFALSPDVDVFRNRAKASLKVKYFEEGDDLLSDDALTARYYEGYLAVPPETSRKKRAKREAGQKFGTLYVVYTREGYLKAKREHPDFDAFQARGEGAAPDNAIVLSPDSATDFSPYNEIVFLESPPPQFFRCIDASSAGEVRVEGDAPKFKSATLTIERLRELYVLFSKNLDRLVYTSKAELHEISAFESVEKLEFSLAFLIFQETGLLIVDKSGIIHIVNRKTDLNASAIYRSLHAAT